MGALLGYISGAVTGAIDYYRLSNSQKFERRFGGNAEANAVYREYFSAYANDYLRLDSATLDRIDQIVQRKAVGQEIGRNWSQILLRPALDASHRPIPNEPLLKTALSAQFTFDRELTKLKVINECQKLLYEKLLPEVKLLERLTPMFTACASRVFSVRDQIFISELRSKAAFYGTTLKAQACQSLKAKKMLVKELQMKIKAIQKDKLTPQEASWMNPASPEMRHLRILSANLDPSEIGDKSKLHSCLRDHAVISVGDPILQEDARFVIVKRPVKMPQEVWWRLNSTANTAALIAQLNNMNLEPNCSVYVDFEGISVEVCFEPSARVLKLHEDRDLREKTRRDVVGKGEYQRTNRREEVGFFGAVKDLWRQVSQANWSEHREATAGPDGHEAIAVHRNMAAKVLLGDAAKIPQRVAQNLGEYFDSLAVSDIGQLKGSYMSDPNFVQALNTQKSIQTHARNFFQSRMILPILQKGVETQYEWRKDLPRLALLTEDIYESYANWSRNLSGFLDELDQPTHSKLVQTIGDETMKDLFAFNETLRQFVDSAPPEELRGVIAERRAIFERYNGQLNLAARQELDQVWINWRQNRTSAEIDQILSTAFNSMGDWIKLFTPSLVKIGVPFTSPQMQKVLGDLMKGHDQLIRLYQGAIPPVWQNKVKIQLLINGELLQGTELSPLWLRMAQTLEVANSEVCKNEFIRSQLAKQNL